MNKRANKLIHWIAALAILMSALAPSISQAFSFSKSDTGFVAEICTTSGTKITQAIDDEGPSSSSATMQGHCPYCVVSPLYLLQTATAPEFYASERYVKQSLSSYRAPPPLFSWLSLPSRAPPVLS
jgi:Protein of unknown function (DUF2946)